MSETDNDESLADAVFDEAPAEPEEVKAAEAPKKPKSAGTSVAWLALFLSLITVAGVGYLVIEKMRAEGTAAESDQQVASLSGRLSSTDESIGRLDENIGDLESAGSRNAAAIDDLQRQLDRRGELLDSVPPRMSAIERSVASLQGVSIDARNTYLVAEAEYYMQIANAQLQLAGNPYLASLALGQADDRLLQLADPALTDVRRAIADELAALEVMEKPDVAGVTLTLASLARIVEALPMRTVASAREDQTANDDEDLTGTARAMQAFRDFGSNFVKVTPPDEDQIALITPEFSALARANLALQLQAARLALLRGEQEVFEQSLSDADAWLGLYFDTTSEQVSSARQTIAEIGNQYSNVAPPDISLSLRLLRQYKMLGAPAAASETAE